MELRLLVAVAGILVGLGILLAGVRVLRPGDPRSTAFRRAGPEPSIVSGVAFIVAGVLLIVLSVQAIAQVQHEIMTMVKPTSTFRLDTLAGPAQDRSPDRRDRDRLR